MGARIEDYALVGDTQTAALISRDGSLDWACFPRFDSGACFAALIGQRENGRWRIAPDVPVRAIRRRYRPGTLILETEMDTDGGTCRLIDFMPVRGHAPDIVRIVEGVRGTVPMRSDLVIRFDTGRVVPWVRRHHDALVAIAGPDALCIRGDVAMHGEGLATVGTFDLKPGQRRSVVMTWFASHDPKPKPVDPGEALAETERWWTGWSGRLTYEGPHRDIVARSMMVLKALTYQPTGGIVAAPTTSLPEWPGGVRNWDYRYCWLRDATLTLYALMQGGYQHEARAWREWLLRAAAGDPSDLQIMYGLAGERRLPEYEAPWLCGYEGSTPGSHRQRRARAAAAGRLRRAHRGSLRVAAVRDPARPVGLGAGEGAAGFAGDEVAPARRRNLGDPRRTAALHVFEGDGLGRVRSGREVGRADSAGWPRREVAAHPRRDPRGGVRARLRRVGEHVHAVVRQPRARRQPADDPAGRLPAVPGRTRAGDGARRRARPDEGRFPAALQDRPEALTGRSAAWRRGVPAVHVLVGRHVSADGTARGGPTAVRPCYARWPTTWACCPRSTTRRRSGCWGIFRKRSRTWR